MSSVELGVVILGLFLGYWIVSTFVLKDRSKRSSSSGGSKDAGANAANDAEASPASWDKVLNVPAEASVDEIRKAYKSLMSQYHPDKVASLGDELKALAEQKSKEITRAYREAMRIRGEDA